MSWKLTKKLKETHLAPLANTFSRSSSTSTITSDSSKATSPLATSSTTNDGTSGNSTADASAVGTNPPLKPGILILTLHEGQNFSLPAGAEKFFAPRSAQNAGSVGSMIAGSQRPGPNDMMNGRSTAGAINLAPTVHGRYSSRHLPYALVDFDKQQIFVNAVSGTPQNPIWAGETTQYKFDVSRPTEIAISLYIRNPKSSPQAGRSEDIFLGTVRIDPRFEEVASVETPSSAKPGKKDKKEEKAALAQTEREKTLGQFGVAWNNLTYGSGSLRLGVKFVETRHTSLKLEDFELLKVVGKGSFGKVMQVQKKDTHRIYALKTIRKQHIISRSEVAHTLAERSVLSQINNPFIVPLKFSFQSPEKLYFVLAFVNGGELFHHLQREQRFDINRSRFYAAELLCALECLHGFNVIYRDLKPENILLDYTGHIALCDFGLCKLDMKDEDKTNTFCGTPEYLAPELLHGVGYTKTVDWWTLGVLLYEMLTGLPPFYDENTNAMYGKILSDPLTFPDVDVVPEAARDLLTKLLNRDATKRLGVNGASEIKAHPFFHSIDWRKLLDRKYEPTFKPNVADERDTANFDREFTSEAPMDSYVDGPLLSSTMQQQFKGWSYNRPIEGLTDGGGSLAGDSILQER